MRPLIEQGYLYIAQPPLFRSKRGASEVYLKDQHALDDYLITAGLKDGALTNEAGLQVAGPELKELVEKSVSLSRTIDQLTFQIENRDVIEQAAIAGMLRLDVLSDSDSARLLAERMDHYSDPLEQGWTGVVEDAAAGPEIVLRRTLRGITETHRLDKRLVTTAEARQLNGAADLLKEMFSHKLTFASGTHQSEILGPSHLATHIVAQGRKGAQIARYKGLGEMNPDQLWETTLDPNQRTLLQVRVTEEEDANMAFSTLMGEAVEERRNFIQENALKVSNLDI
jgi:DNA gyrase subunit B